MTDRVLVLLADADVGAVVNATSSLAPGTWRVLRRRGADPLAGSHFERLVADTHPFDVVVDLAGGDPCGAVGALVPLVGSSARLLAGTTVGFFGGPGSVSLLYLLARRADLAPAAFREHWQHRHTALPFPSLAGYRQLHVDPVASRDLACGYGLDLAPYDGVSEVGYTNEDEVRRVSRDPRVAEGAALDELVFVDHARSAVSLVEVVAGATAW